MERTVVQQPAFAGAAAYAITGAHVSSTAQAFPGIVFGGVFGQTIPAGSQVFPGSVGRQVLR